MSSAEQDTFRELIRRRSTGEPVAYITGRRGFWSVDLEVGPGVLVPRPETELLVEIALARGGAPRPADAGPLRVLDVGTGSGAIAIAIAKELPESVVVAIDRSPEALAIARRNVETIVPGRVELLEGDGFAPVTGRVFDLVLSNPPYIPTGDIAGLMRDVRDHEPRAALDGGPDGLDVVRAWAPAARACLAPGGWAMFEIGAGQGAAAARIFREAGFADVSLKDDLAGIPRVVAGRNGPSTK